MNVNQKITPDELKRIRALPDFDLVMLLSEISDHGWPVAKHLLQLIEASLLKQRGDA